MNSRERFLTLIQGKRPDRMPFWYGGPRTSTFAAWRRQGLSQDQQNRWGEFVTEEGFRGIGKLDFEPLPRFEEIILKEEGNERTWIDHYGVKRIDAIHQPTAGFSTRRYLEFPIKDRDSFRKYAERYDPRTPERYEPVPGESERDTANPDGYRVEQGSAHWNTQVAACNEGDQPVSVTVPGLWWTLRDWCGFEGVCMMCAEEPDLVEEMMGFWADFIIAVLEEPLSRIRVDHVMMNEDIAYKTAAMLSPAMMRRFMLPNYLRLRAFFRAKGVASVMMDTDGHCGQVIDVFYPDGFDGIAPLEIAANNDPETYLRKHPGLTMFGGIDKRELHTTKERARAEVVRRYRLAREFPNYIPTVDHGVPPDVPLRIFLYMAELLQGFAMGESLETFESACRLEQELGRIEEMFDPKAAYAAAYGAD
ncbi:MAG: uroporphyrinogen decarboxylase family protein [Fimbriimonadales bacterium]